mmetsp:Transcript_118717/g.296012  ORF Transcript_118717/g.296012 Transcript_118717/m.296012 type:complete len:362 (-) Transcript_118717:82-1167(-)
MGSAHASCIARVDTGALSHEGGAGVALNGDLMYIAGGHGLAVFDLSDPALPKRLGSVIDTGVIRANKTHTQHHHESARLAAELVLVDNELFVAGNKGLAVFDVSDAAAPKPVATLDTGALSHEGDSALAVCGKLLYVAGGKGLAVIDISDPTSLKPACDVIDTKALSYDGGAAIALASEADCAVPVMYVAGGKGLAVFDISTPEAPKKIGDTIDTGALSSSQAGATIGLLGNVMHVVGGKGVSVFDISNPLEPQRLGGVIDTGAIGWAGDVALAYVGCEDVERRDTMLIAGGKGLRVFSIADPQKPEAIGEVIDTGALASDGGAQLVAHGPYVYVIGGKGLVVLDPVKADIDVAAQRLLSS